MVQQDTDGLSQGDLTARVMISHNILSYTPLHLSVIDRSCDILPWVQSWCPDATISPLLPREWYERGHGIKKLQMIILIVPNYIGRDNTPVTIPRLAVG
jgi:hypothetical protein